MRPPKSSIITTCLTLLFTVSLSFSQGYLLKVNDSSKACSFDTSKLNLLVKNDSLYKATTLLNKAIAFSEKHNLKPTQAKAYYSLAKVLTKMSNYKNAEIYHLKALNIYTTLNDEEGRNAVLSSLVHNYLSEKNYKKFDSLYPKAQQISKQLNSELYFFNLEHKIKRYYYTRQNKALLNTTNFAIDTLTKVDFASLNYSDRPNESHTKKTLLQSYKFYNSIANIKFADYKAEGFKLLFKLNENDLKTAFKTDNDFYRKLASFNYYKYLYYAEANKNLDSANKYLLKSDTYKYTALADYENRNSRNGELIYKIINTEQKLSLAKEISKKDTKASQLFLATAILMTFLLLATLVIFYFYTKAKKKLLFINEELIVSNNKLLEIDKDRLEFFSILSHELRTPIYGITGLATLVNQEDDDTKRQSYLDSLISSSNYLSILIDNILQANKLRFEEKTLRLKPDKIRKIINHVVSSVKIAAKNKGLELITKIEASDEAELVLIDKVAFSQILINLAYNAIRYTKEGHITLLVVEKARTSKDVTLRFEVNDTGIGIKEKHRSVVFSAFENKAFLHKNSSGSGLGLHIVKTLLKSHGADIDFISEPGKGTSFFFEVTFNIVLALKLKESIPIIELQQDMHILIVDDNKINLLITKKNIEKIQGCTCEVISNGKEAISIIKNKAFDLVLMDINMPDMDGYDVTKHIRMFNPDIPILALTALNSAEISTKAEEAGINQIITKPFLFEDFKATISSFGNKRKHYTATIDLDAI
ncbi:response regulator [uncultured Winogradskyella sp.]|uniref:hybrid sensor histidine kinase/response regulator n=1 Tax=uncultured Winogradskyella sp. TaxID=395353 RepID=UPI0030DAB921|tara:strand:+ start:53833 stop:56118 length:2286 start_codon:yes stop_codon:yes gene_type:complete